MLKESFSSKIHWKILFFFLNLKNKHNKILKRINEIALNIVLIEYDGMIYVDGTIYLNELKAKFMESNTK